MLEAKLAEAQTLKKLLEGTRIDPTQTRFISFTTPAIKELVTDANFQCGEEGIVRISRHFTFDARTLIVRYDLDLASDGQLSRRARLRRA